MKKLSITLALVIASTFAHASGPTDQTVTSADGKTKAVVHVADFKWFINESEDLQTVAWVTTIQRNEVTRVRYTVTGCDKAGGRIAAVNGETGVVIGAQNMWLQDGYSMLDSVAAATCTILVGQHRAAKAAGRKYLPNA